MPKKKKEQPSNFISKLRAYFLSGILVIAPIAITFYVVWWVLSMTDSLIESMIPAQYLPKNNLPIHIPGVGLIISVALVILIGSLVKGMMGRALLNTGERLLERMPIIRGIYTGTKKLFQAVLDTQGSSFKEVGLIEYPRKGLWTICFLTGTTQGQVQELTDDCVENVFVPTTPNPTSGFLIFVPKRDIRLLDLTVDEGLKLVITAGIVTPDAPERLLEEFGVKEKVNMNPSKSILGKKKRKGDG